MQGTVSLSHPNTTFWRNLSTNAHLQTARKPYANQMYGHKPVAACVSWQVTYICRMYCRVIHRKGRLTLRLGTVLRSIGKKESSTHDNLMRIVQLLGFDCRHHKAEAKCVHHQCAGQFCCSEALTICVPLPAESSPFAACL